MVHWVQPYSLWSVGVSRIIRSILLWFGLLCRCLSLKEELLHSKTITESVLVARHVITNLSHDFSILGKGRYKPLKFVNKVYFINMRD